MALTPRQRAARRSRIGSSDSPPIAGVDPWKTPHDVFLEKIHLMDDLTPGEPVEIGNDFELPLLRWAARELGVEIETNVQVLAPHDALMAANHDALIIGKREGLEAKTTSLSDEYGEEGTDQVPDRVIVQTQHQCYVSELDLVWVPVLLARFDRLHRVMYRVPRNDKLIKLVVERDHAFWHNHVVPRLPPPGSAPSMDIIKRIRRIPETIVTVPPALVESFKAKRAARLAAEEAEDDAQALLIAAAGEADALDWGDAKKIYTYLESTKSGVDTERLRRDHPALFQEYLKQSKPFRTLREVNRPR